MARGIKLVSITDHHDMGFVPYVVKAAREHPGILVLPGVEITCNDNTQCLTYFDPSVSDETWKLLLGKLKGVSQAASDEAKALSTNPAHMTILEYIEEICSEPQLKDHVLVLPHFSDLDSHKSLNEEGHHARFASIRCDGVYIEKPFSQLAQTTVEKAYGHIEAWGSRRRAIVPTGDNKRASLERLGAHECWIKLGDDTIEGLRQALLADQARIAHANPSIPHERIIEIRTLSNLTGADVFSFTLNEGFNAIIGGRGVWEKRDT